MISGSIDVRAITEMLNKAERDVKRAISQGLRDGFVATVEATPYDTGFLQASWFIQIDGAPASHPSPPDYDLKRQHDMARNFRRIGGRDVPIQSRTEPLPKRDPAFVGNANDVAARFSHEMQVQLNRGVTTKSVSFVNDAPYAALVAERDEPFDAVAVVVTENAIRRRLKSRRRRSR